MDISYSPFLIYGGDEVEKPNLPFIEDVEGILGMRIELVPLREAQNVQVVQSGLVILTGGDASDWINALGTSQLGERFLERFLLGTSLVDENLDLVTEMTLELLFVSVLEVLDGIQALSPRLYGFF